MQNNNIGLNDTVGLQKSILPHIGCSLLLLRQPKCLSKHGYENEKTFMSHDIK